MRTLSCSLLWVALGLAACAESPTTPDEARPNDGMLRDFIDGKFDAAGHPLNAKIVSAAELSLDASCGNLQDGSVQLKTGCRVELPPGADGANLVVNARLRVRAHPSSGTIVTVTAIDSAGTRVGTQRLTVSTLRERGRWIDLPISIGRSSGMAHLELAVAAGALVDLQYVEVFPKQLGVIVSPGSGVFADSAKITFELPRGQKIEKLEANGVDVKRRLETLVSAGTATKTTTEFRTLFEVSIGDLLPGREDVVELRVHANGDTSRTQLRKTAPPCTFVGDPTGAKVLVTGFQPFPADGWHDNIAGVAVTALDPRTLHGAQVMKLVLPVEYDRAAATITDVIERCQPQHVLSFGQGSNAIALEELAYNLQDTGELAGGAPDNRGIIRAAAQIDPTAPAQRETLLPLDDIEAALVDLGEAPQRSTDPGRYICNNVMFNNIGRMAQRGRAGFIHLPYTTQFDDAVRARWGKVAAAAVQATVDAP